jgi:hypothetical protein
LHESINELLPDLLFLLEKVPSDSPRNLLSLLPKFSQNPLDPKVIVAIYTTTKTHSECVDPRKTPKSKFFLFRFFLR